MLEEKRLQRCFQIGEAYLFLKRMGCSITIEYSNIHDLQDVYGVTFVKKLPQYLVEYFSGFDHLYKYIENNPQKIISLTEQRIQMVYLRGDKQAFFTIEFQRNKVQFFQETIKRRILILKEQIDYFRSQQNKIKREANTFNGQMLGILTDAQQRYHGALKHLDDLKAQYHDKKAEKVQLKSKLKEKEEFLHKLSQKVRECIVLDD